MSTPREADDVKLIASLFSHEKQLVDDTIANMEGLFGPPDRISPWLLFDRTRYYEREMGWPLNRRFISFEKLIRPEALVDAKIATNKIEKTCILDGKRRINIDPGYISLERLVLATGKNYTHRIYLSKGIFADLTLVFHGGSFRSLEWTYRDYADQAVIDYFNEERMKYKKQLRGLDIVQM